MANTNKQAALALIKQGKSYGEVATELKISRSTVAGYVYRNRYAYNRNTTDKTPASTKPNVLQLSYF